MNETGTGMPVSQSAPPTQSMHLGAVVLGWAVDIGVSIAIGFIIQLLLGLVIGVKIVYVQQPFNSAEVAAAIMELARTLPVMLVFMVLGSMATVLGGFFSAFIAKRDEIWHALAMGVLSLLWGALMIALDRVTGQDSFPLWYSIIGIVVTLPCALLGGWLCARMCRNRRAACPGAPYKT